MKKNQSGFTLIELLAVIIILSVIALIAVPTIMGIIEGSREEAEINSAYGVVSAVETYVAQDMLTNNSDGPTGIVFTESGEHELSSLPIKGTKPIAGTVKICTGSESATGDICSGKKKGEIVVSKLKFRDNGPTYSTQTNGSDIVKDS